MKRRLCKICGMPLSYYNKANICFYHNDHPLRIFDGKRNPNPMEDIYHPRFSGVGHATPMLNQTIMDYYDTGNPWYVF